MWKTARVARGVAAIALALALLAGLFPQAGGGPGGLLAERAYASYGPMPFDQVFPSRAIGPDPYGGGHTWGIYFQPAGTTSVKNAFCINRGRSLPADGALDGTNGYYPGGIPYWAPGIATFGPAILKKYGIESNGMNPAAFWPIQYAIWGHTNGGFEGSAGSDQIVQEIYQAGLETPEETNPQFFYKGSLFTGGQLVFTAEDMGQLCRIIVTLAGF